MQKTNINPEIFQEFLESATNAAAKGQAQYFTPYPWAKALAEPLPRFRQTIIDLCHGNAALLAGASNSTTEHLLGADIDSLKPLPEITTCRKSVETWFTQADLTLLYPLLKELDFEADLFTLNPPFDLHWHRDRLSALAKSSLSSVQDAFANHDPRISKDTIDSTVATLMIALDRCSQYGEGYLIANESTLQRLILQPNAPHHALAEHCWLHAVIPGNICIATKDNNSDSEYRTGILYFARSHYGPCHEISLPANILQAHGELTCINRFRHRRGTEVRDYLYTQEVSVLWNAAADEYKIRYAKAKAEWNLVLDTNGFISTNLSLFQQHSNQVNKRDAEKLFTLNGRRPMQVVMQRAQRDELLRHCGLTVEHPAWRVHPELITAVQSAILAYHAERAPLYPLPAIQRLGYLDEEDSICCIRDLATPDHIVVFRAGDSYKLRSQTVSITRPGTKCNLEGEIEEVAYCGQELAFFITNCHGAEMLFMEDRLKEAGAKLHGIRSNTTKASELIDFNLHDLTRCFMIPEVKDVATLNPIQYQANLTMLDTIETLCNSIPILSVI
ncbi:MAG: hypothetical protein WCO56_24090 [Verrucomicrobiota bacterium]